MASAPAPAKDHTTTVVGPTTSSPSPNHKPTGSTSSSAAGPATTTTASVGATPSSPGGTHEQLAQLLAKAYNDIEGLHRELSQTKRRAEQAERVAQRLTAVAEASSSSSPNGNGTGVVPEHVTRIIRELEDRLTHSEMAREEAEVRRRFVMDQWIQVENYLGQLEVKVQEAKFGFMRVLREGVPVSLSEFFFSFGLARMNKRIVSPTRSPRYQETAYAQLRERLSAFEEVERERWAWERAQDRVF
jgi:hypothetical protein